MRVIYDDVVMTSLVNSRWSNEVVKEGVGEEGLGRVRRRVREGGGRRVREG